MDRPSSVATIAALTAALLFSAGSAAQAPHTHKHSFTDADKWSQVFDDPARDAWQKPHEVIQALALKPDAVIADIGAGTGYFAVRFAHMVPNGHVHAVDTEAEMVRFLERRARREGLKNLIAILGTADDPRLTQKADLIVLVDVYHHLDNRERYFRRLHDWLKPGGRLAVIDFRPDAQRGPPKNVRLAPERVKQELQRAGFRLAAEPDFLPQQYFLIFEAVR